MSLDPMVWIECDLCEKFRCDIMAQTYALIAPVQPILYRVLCSNETLPNAPKYNAMHQNMSLWSNGVDWVRSLQKKFWCDFVAHICVLFAPVQQVWHRVSCSNETLTNAPKHYKMHQNMSIGSNVVDLVRSLPKIPMRVPGTNFCINCSSSTNFAPSFMQ